MNTGTFGQFEAELEALRARLKIPALSAAIVEDQNIVWAKGFGYADLENRIEATPDTPYHLASLTKPFAAAVVMQLVEAGELGLDDPISRYGVRVDSEGEVLVRHLLTMTSEGNPGERYEYDGARFGHLSQIIEQASGRSFQDLLIEKILEPLAMTNTAPSRAGAFQLGREGDFEHVYEALASPYQLDHRHEVEGGRYPDHFSAAAGLISTAVDVAAFDIAMDQNVLVSQETKEQMFAPTVSTSGVELPYGMGWHAQRYDDVRLVWHWGHWDCNSSLILKVPDENLTFIVLANTDNLSRPYGLDSGDVLRSTVALAFLRNFVFPSRYGESVPDVDWEASEQDLVDQLQQYEGGVWQDVLGNELWSYSQLFASVGETELADRLRDVCTQLYIAPRIAGKIATGVDPQTYTAYEGEYDVPPELGEGTVIVEREGDRLFLTTPDDLKFELFPMSETSFFHTEFDESYEFEVTFVGAETGQVTQMMAVLEGQTFYLERINP